MKYLLVLFLAAVAGLEFFHELSSSDASSSTMCIAPQAKLEGIGDILRQHLDSRR